LNAWNSVVVTLDTHKIDHIQVDNSIHPLLTTSITVNE